MSINEENINLFNKGNNYRDFTYIDDITEGINNIILNDKKETKFNIYNMGNNNPISTNYFVELLEKNLRKKAIITFIEKQKGDVEKTWADINLLNNTYSFSPKTNIEQGLKSFCKWFSDYEKSKKNN